MLAIPSAVTGMAALIALAVGGADGTAARALAGGPQGTLVFASDRSGTFQIYSIRADGARLGQLTRGRANDDAPLFSPDGRRIVFVRNRSQLWVMKADGSGQRKLASSGAAPSWSPDSQRIAYVGADDKLVVARPYGSARVVVRRGSSSPHWSPDGRLIAFSRGVGDRADLAVVRGDGNGLRTVRRNAGPVGWSPRGEIAFVGRYGSGVGLIGADGRHARPLLDFNPSFLVWSPDGRRLAFVAGNGLYVASATGRGIRRLPPNDAFLDSPSWSPDSRWIAISFAPKGSELRDVLLVHADGSSSRRPAARLATPWGTSNTAASWRPKGATPARLGRRPVASPSESVSASSFRPGTGTISELAADGGLAAIVLHAEPRFCAAVEAWEHTRRRFVRLYRDSCVERGSVYEPAHGLGVAGRRVAWLEVGGGNTTQTDIRMATPERPAPVYVAEGNANSSSAYGTSAGEPIGHGTLLAFTIEDRCEVGHPEPDYSDRCPPSRKTGIATTVWRVGGRERCGPPASFRRPGCTRVAQVDSRLTVLAVDSGRLVVRTEGGVKLLTAAGEVLRDLPVAARAAALSGNRLALRTGDAIEVYDTGSGQRIGRFPVPKTVTLQDLEGDILVTASGATVTLRKLGNGHTVVFGTVGPAKAALEEPGLYLAGTGRVTFTPMRDVLRRLGS